MLPAFSTKAEEKADLGRERALLPSWAVCSLRAKCLVYVVPGIMRGIGLRSVELCWVDRHAPFTDTTGKRSMGSYERPKR